MRRVILVIDGVEFDIKDIFKFPSNFAAIYRKLGIKSYEYLFDRFGGLGEVKYYLNKAWYVHNRKSGNDMRSHNIQFTDKFKEVLYTKGVKF